VKAISIAAVPLAFLALSLGSCMSLHQKVYFKAIPRDLPVSASSSLLVDGMVVESDAFQDSVPFSIQKEVSIPLSTKEEVVDLYPELKAEAQKDGGNAIAKLKVSILNFDSSDYNLVFFERDMGALLALTGGALAIEFSVLSASMTSDPYGSSYGSASGNDALKGMILPCAIVGGAGVALFGGSYLQEKRAKSVYTIGLEGQSVKITKPLE
jgi:hypothetical protein